MKSLTALFVFLLLAPLVAPVALAKNSSEKIRVRLRASQSEVLISGTGLRVQGLNSNFQPVAIPSGSETIRIRRFEKDKKIFWLISRPSSFARSQILHSEMISISGQNLRSAAQSLPAHLLLTAAAAKKMDLIGVLDLEDYLVGVLASEMPLTWPLETLKAQAVAARSYTLAVIGERRKKTYHLESSILDQVYRHISAMDSPQLLHRAIQAVQETKNLKLLIERGSVLKAYYHSDCGGKTVPAQQVWPSAVSAGETADDSCPANPKAHWEYSLNKENLYGRIKKFFQLGPSAERVSAVNFMHLPGEERISEVQVQFENSESRSLTANEFRGLIGFQELKSTLFTVEENEKGFLFEGRGFGHGVGLCQWGSRAMGLQGKSYRDILKHYYPLARLDSSPLSERGIKY